MPGGRGVTDDLGRLIVSNIPCPIGQPLSGTAEICLTQIGRQI